LKPRTKPVGSVNHIQRIYSHPQAFGQCEIFLGAYLKGIERVDVTSTSKAAELVAADLVGTSAAIASQIAAEVEGLDVIAQGIEDKADNTTRFFVLRKGEDAVSVRRTSHDEENVPGIPTKSLVSFAVDHRSPGALANVLDCFRESKLNLTSINSRPSRIVPFQYIFFVELEGDRIHDPEGAVKAAMRNVQEVAQSCRWLGSYENRLRR
jgi:prephenate dehydratase